MKRVLQVVGIIIVVLVLVVVALPFLIDADQFRPRLEAELTKQLAREVKLGHLQLSVLSGGVTASDLSIADDPKFSRTPFLSAQSLSVAVDMSALIFSRQLNVNGVTIDHPSIALLQSPSGAWNFSSLGEKTAPVHEAAPGTVASSLGLSVKLVKIADGRLVLARTDRKAKPEVFDPVNIELRDLSVTSVFPFSMTAAATGGAQIKLQGTAGPLNPVDAAATPVNASLNIAHLDLAHSGFLPPTNFAGLVTLGGTLASSGQKVQIKGNIQAEQLVLAKGGTPAKKPAAFDFAVEHDVQKHAGQLQRGQIHIGSATASLTGSYRTEGENTLVNMLLSAPGMAVPELEAMLPAMNIVLPMGSSLEGGTASAKVTVAGSSDNPVLDGTVALNNTRLAGFDLGSKMTLVTKLAGIKNGPNTEIQNLSADLHYDNQGLRAQNISLIAPEIGELNGAGTVSPAHALDFQMTAKLRGGGVLAVLGSSTSVPFRIEGTSSDPKFEPDVKGMVQQKLKGLEGGKAAGDILRGILGGKKN